MNLIGTNRGRAALWVMRLAIVAITCASAIRVYADPVTAEPVAPALTLQPQLAPPFTDNAILQQQIAVPVWGTSLPGASVTVSFDGQTQQAKADALGHWRVTLDPMVAQKLKSVNDAPAGKAMTITCERNGKTASAQVKNILVGEVWLAAGQSNMAGKLRTKVAGHYPSDTLAKADYPAFRQFSSGQADPWLICSPQTAPDFRKVCFYFGRRVYQDALVPIGIIHGAVGGSRIEPWFNSEKARHYQKYIKPVAGYAIRGAIWYQGESNAKDGRDYGPKLRQLITGWRTAWKQSDAKSLTGPHGDFSFYFVQLPGIGKSTTENPAQGDGRAEIREAQFQTLALPNTGMAVTLDIGAVHEHPPNKYDTGVRLGRLALHNDYGFAKLTPTGPLYKSHRIVSDAIEIEFDHASAGLMLAQKQGFEPPRPTPDATLGWLSIRDAAGQWHWADGKIDGRKLIVTAPGVKRPTAVRYAYTIHPAGPLLYSRDGLPAGPFTTCGYDPKPQPDQ